MLLIAKSLLQKYNTILPFSSFAIYLSCMCTCMRANMHAYGGRKTTCWTWLSLSTTRNQIQVAGLMDGWLLCSTSHGHSTFQSCEGYPAGTKLPGKEQLDFSMFYSFSNGILQSHSGVTKSISSSL